MEDAKPKYRFLIPAEEFIKGSGTTWLIENVLVTASLAIIYAQPKHFKTFVALDMAKAVLTGEPFCGFETKETGSVVYMALEGRGGARKRVEAILRDANLLGAIHATEHPFRMPETSRLEWPSLMEDLKAFAEAHGAIKLIILDTFAQFSEADENNSTAVSGVIRLLQELIVVTGATVCLIHHALKPPKRKGSSQRGMRGSSALNGAADTVIYVERAGDSLFAQVACDKQKDFNEFDDFYIELGEVTLGEKQTLRVKGLTTRTNFLTGVKWKDRGQASASPTRTKAKNLILKNIQDAGPSGLRRAQVKTALVPKAISDGTFNNAWRELQASGEIVGLESGAYVVPSD